MFLVKKFVGRHGRISIIWTHASWRIKMSMMPGGRINRRHSVWIGDADGAGDGFAAAADAGEEPADGAGGDADCGGAPAPGFGGAAFVGGAEEEPAGGGGEPAGAAGALAFGGFGGAEFGDGGGCAAAGEAAGGFAPGAAAGFSSSVGARLPILDRSGPIRSCPSTTGRSKI